ncbi:MAG: class I SAM-dependent methyltransferase [Oculatellaceae cyanobacterium Prado106]|jgi:SAM-dependent methyltransferase|nr:class I SAM-dependent methyltransferase [Oculatellaceae cyanobacterium Prado106]
MKGQNPAHSNLGNFLGDRTPTFSPDQLAAVALRYNKEYRRESFELPAEMEAMPIFREWASGALSSRIASPFWELVKPKKHQRCLDLGCGVSFLIYPWSEWDAVFYGQDISSVARDLLNSRGSQLNSKLFKGVKLAAAHELNYEELQFDLVIATGFSCYYPLNYWQLVLQEVKKALKPDGFFLFDVINPEAEMAENWAILETYLGAEVFLEPLSDWQKMLKATGAQIAKTVPGELFQMYKVKL